jgi:hypothetical protein
VAITVRLSIVNRIWRGVMCAGFAAVTALAGCSSSPHCPPGASCPAIAARVTFIPTINGQTTVPRKDGHVPRYPVRSGESLTMRVTVTVPARVEVTTLWFGISTGTWGSGPKGHPVGMKPILARFHRPLSPGSHTFNLRWNVPQHRPATSLYLTYAWSSRQPPVEISGAIATFMLT